jgi:hypothetical protein
MNQPTLYVLACACAIAVGGCGSSPEPTNAAKADKATHPLVGHWAAVSINDRSLPPNAELHVTFRECECIVVDPHGNTELAKLYDTGRLWKMFRAYRATQPGVGEQVALSEGDFQIVLRRLDEEAAACCSGSGG